jgi:hypothetical protein
MIDIIISPLINPNPIPSKGSSASPRQRTLRGKIVSIRKGRKGKRRLVSCPAKPVPIEKRIKREQRIVEINQDNSAHQFLLCEVENTENLSVIKGKEIMIRVID